MIIIATALALYVAYYFVSKPLLRKLSSAAARAGLPLFPNATIAERQAVFQMSLVVTLHLLLVCSLARMVLPAGWWDHQVTQPAVQGGVAVLAVGLGIGETVASGVLAESVHGLLGWIDTQREARGHRSRMATEMVDASSGGWMKTIRLSVEVSLPVGATLLVLQLSCEEIIFRFIFPRCMPGGMWTAGVLFVLMQFGGMKRRIGGAFAAVGASVMAIAQGYLATRTDLLLPLVIAHTAMFLSSRTLSSE